MSKRMAVYGTLKKGFGNHHFMRNSTFVGTTRIEGFDMYSVTGYFPGIIRGSGSIEAEVYDVPAEDVPNIDSLEAYRAYSPETSMYLRETVASEFGNVAIYVWNRPDNFEGKAPIDSGVWE